ncbi:MAG: DUF1460 domain-containing protein [Duncaniella sp.]|nr:DUF1460 domain-containing protein [Duncaniella sp.]MDE5733830.1 DUF1460 domain-containing protein [Duncaniella sp.]
MKRHPLSIILLPLLSLLLPLGAGAVMPGEVRWNNQAADTIRINRLLTDAAKMLRDQPQPATGPAVAGIAETFTGTPYKSGTLEGSPEMLTVNLDSLDCTTFVETVVAIVLTAEDNRTAWQDYLFTLEQLRYRQGKIDGYSSRLHYASDWIVDNIHRGNLREITDRLPGAAYQVKTLDYMTAHRDAYPALADSVQYEKVKNFEIGYRSHRYPYIRSSALQGKWGRDNLSTGDIILFTTKTNGLDVSHMGIIIMQKDGPHLLHASSREGRVVLDPRPLSEYMAKNRGLSGARILRPARR